MIGRTLGRKIALSTIALLAILILCAAAFVQFEQHLLRWRAERLLDDIHSIEMGKSTWPDAQRLMARWGRWGAWQGECSARRCDYQIVIEDVFHVMPVYEVPGMEMREPENLRFAFLHRPYYWVGGRFAMVAARIQVKNGIVWTKAFEVIINETSNIPFQNESDYGLFGSGWAFSNYQHNHLSPSREYAVIHPPCTGCKSLDVEYSPFADPAIVNRLLDFRLSCLAKIFNCREPSELMPAAWTFYNKFEQQNAVRPAVEVTDFDLIEKNATDTRYAALATIVGTHSAVKDGKPARKMIFKITQSLKGSVPQGLEFSMTYPLRPPMEEMIGGTHFGDLRSGARTIAIFGVRPDQPEPDAVQNGYYEIIPCTDRTLSAVQRGIARDKLADVP